jgi:hypothetical protein
MLIGCQIGGPGGDIIRPGTTVIENEMKAFKHSPQTWESMWKEVGERTGRRLMVNATHDISEWFVNMRRKTEETS